VGKIEKINGSGHPLRLTRRKKRQLNPRRSISARVRVKCGCCDEAIDICHDEDLHSADSNTLEINGVMGSIAQWRKVFAPLLGFQEVRTSTGGLTKVAWESKID